MVMNLKTSRIKFFVKSSMAGVGHHTCLIPWLRGLVLSSAMLSLGLVLDTATAAEELAENLILRKTYLKTSDEFVRLGSDPSGKTEPDTKPAFTPTIVRCPVLSNHTCTIRVEVSSEFFSVHNPPDDGALTVFGTLRIDGSSTGVLPDPVAHFRTYSEGSVDPERVVKTFTWMQKGAAKGEHTVELDFSLATDDGGLVFSNRTLTIQVYRE